MPDAPEAAVPAPPAARASIAHVDLALSGGGFRATLFHLGVIACLRDHELLPRVRIICSVSGGSILAAHLVSHWDEYRSESNDAFRRRASQLASAIMTRDVSQNVLAKSDDRLIEFKPLDTEQLAEEYLDLLDLRNRGHRWDQMPVGRPQLYILATNLNTGLAGAFSTRGFDLLPAAAGHRHEEEIEALRVFAAKASIRNQSITRAVAASSAFPPAFSPIPLEEGGGPHMLTDGGVYDNSGVNYLRYLYSPHPPDRPDLPDRPSRLVIVSDAGREFPTGLTGDYDTFLTLALRVTDTQGGRIAEADSEAARTFFKTQNIRDAIFLSIQDRAPEIPGGDDNHSEKLQNLLRAIRTELNTFTREEVFVLYRHGYRVTHRALEKHGISDSETHDPRWTPARSESEDLHALTKDALEKRLARSHEFKKELWPTLLRLARKKILKDYPWGIAAAVVLGAALLAAVAYVSRRVGAPTTVSRATPRGSLSIAEATLYVGEGWVKDIPILQRFTGPSYTYTLATVPIGSLTGNQPHAEAVIRFDAEPPLGFGVDLFLDQQSAGERRLVALRQSGTGLRLPPGEAGDRLVGIFVPGAFLPDALSFANARFNITLEAP